MNLQTKPTKSRHALRFRFRGREVALERFSPRRTVLDWLREDERRHRHEGRLRRGRLRRLHGRARAPAPRQADLRAGQRLHPAARPARRRGADHSRGSRRGRDAASGAAGDGRPSRLAMRLLHARHRDEPVRAYHSGAAATAREPLRRSSPAISAAAPAIGRSSIAGACDLRRRAGRPLRRDGRRARPRACGARRRRASSSSATKARSSPRPRASTSLAALYAAFPDAILVGGRDRCRALGHQAAARPRSGSSGSAGWTASTRSRRAPTAMRSAPP